MCHKIVDTGYILRLKSFLDATTTFYTTPDVVKELKDRNSVAYFQNYEAFITVQQPNPDSFKYVCAVAKLTGDDFKLSTTDCSVIALAVDICLKEGVEYRRMRTIINELERDRLNKLADSVDEQKSVMIYTTDNAVANVGTLIGIKCFNSSKKKVNRVMFWNPLCK